VVLFAAVAILIVIWGVSLPVGPGDIFKSEAPESIKEKQGEEAAKETQKLIDEAKKIAEEMGENQEEIGGKEPLSKMIEVPAGDGTSTKQAAVVAPGSSGIDTETGSVITEEGEEAKNDAMPGSKDAPKQSFSIEDPEDLPQSTIKLTVYRDRIEPEEFTVNANQAVSLALTSGDRTHIFRFDDPDLQAIALGIGPEETRTITFNAPSNPGEYAFYSDMANFRDLGAEGKMIVK